VNVTVYGFVQALVVAGMDAVGVATAVTFDAVGVAILQPTPYCED
jgi:hypothetical protein